MLRFDRAPDVCRHIHHISEIFIVVELRSACDFPMPSKFSRCALIGLLCVGGGKAIREIVLNAVVDISHMFVAVWTDPFPQPPRKELHRVVVALHLCRAIHGLLEEGVHRLEDKLWAAIFVSYSCSHSVPLR